MPSPVEDRPGLLIRDPFRFSDVTLIIPPPLLPGLRCFDGERSDLDLKKELVLATGQIDVSALQQHLVDTLNEAGFLDNERFAELRQQKMREFAERPTREPAHAGTAYPDSLDDLNQWMEQCLEPDEGHLASDDDVIAIAAPHVSPEGGWESYRDAYHRLPLGGRDRTFIVLGTSHYGEPERFGLTRKAYETPYGAARTDGAMVDELLRRAPRATKSEDYCHSIEHSIEFQILYLQAVYGADITVVPILCGPFAKSIYEGGAPEEDDGVREFFDVFNDLRVKQGTNWTWVLGVDMAHIGRRYGDSVVAQAHQGHMEEVEARDRERIASLASGDAAHYWDLVQRNQDDLKWCGSAPFYTFLRTAGPVNGTLRRYQQWNIDEQSVVSFAALDFRSAS